MAFGFIEFVNKKQRENRRHLGLVKRLLERQNMKVADHREDDDPYIFVPTPQQSLSFDGLRIYNVGNMLAYRVQKREDTSPYGRAYPMDLEEMYNDYMGDDFKEEEAAKQIMQAVGEELARFFKKSSEAEGEIRGAELDKHADGGMGNIVVPNTSGDYGSTITNG